MTFEVPRTFRRTGVGVAGLTFVATLLGVYESYQIWNSPPAYITDGTQPIVVDVATILAGLIFLVIGLYITRNIYRWSMANPDAER